MTAVPRLRLRSPATGAVVFDSVVQAAGKVLGTVATGTGGGSITDASLALGMPFYFLAPSGTAYNPTIGPKTVTISGTTLSWSAAGLATRIVYGVYS